MPPKDRAFRQRQAPTGPGRQERSAFLRDPVDFATIFHLV